MRALIFTALLILLIPSVLSLGIAPAEVEFFHQPGQENTFQLKIVNSGGAETIVSLSITGELAPHITLNQNTLDFEQGEAEKIVQVTVTHPENLEPGPNIASIEVAEIPEEGGQITASLAIKGKITIFSPIDGKHIEARMIPAELIPGKSGNFITEVKSIGTDYIDVIYSEISLSTNEAIVKEFESERKSLPSGEEVLLPIKWTPDVRPGRYHLINTINYDENSEEISKDIHIGSPRIDIESIKIRDYNPGESIDFVLELYNNWNDETQARAQLEFSRNENSAGTSNTIVESFQPYESKKLNAYWDLNNVLQDSHNMKITIYRGESSRTETHTITLEEDSIFIDGELVYKKGSVWPYIIAIFLASILLIFGIRQYLRRNRE